MPEIIDPVFAKTSPKRLFSMTEYECFGLLFTKTRVYKFGHWTGNFINAAPKSCLLPSYIIVQYSNKNVLKLKLLLLLILQYEQPSLCPCEVSSFCCWVLFWYRKTFIWVADVIQPLCSVYNTVKVWYR